MGRLRWRKRTDSQEWRPSRASLLRWSAHILVLSVLLAVLPAALFGTTPPEWIPATLREWAFDVRLTVGPPVKALLSIVAGSFRDDRVYLDRMGETVSFQNRGLRLVGTLYRPDGEGQRPGVLLLHGSTPEGRKLGLYRMLARELAQRGYVVLSMDQRGFGESDDPPRTDQPESFGYTDDARRALDYLESVPSVDAGHLHVIGHSFGANVAIAAGIRDARVRRIVALEPTRRFRERVKGELDYFRRRAMRDMRLAQPILPEVFLSYIFPLLIDSHADYFSRQDHKPLLLVDGGLESPEDRRFLREVYEKMAGRKAYITLADADHYANVANFGPIVFYDRRVIRQLIQIIDDWLSGG